MVIEIPAQNCKYLIQNRKESELPNTLSPATALGVRAFHRQLPGYKPTPLVRLERLARNWGFADIFVKDEAPRFGLKAFKVLGGSYAVARLVCRKLGRPLSEVPYAQLVSDEVREQVGQITLTTATDGNHGRGVAWAAERLGQKAVIFMPKGSAAARVASIRSHGAEVTVTDLNYDDTVRLACAKAAENGWYVVQDTAWEGYTEVPLWIMQGYLTMCAEAVDQLRAEDAHPTHIFVQAGVGALAGAVVGYLAQVYRDPRPRFIILEPNNAACIFASAAAGNGKPHAVKGDLNTIMAGLACGEPNPISWEILRDVPSGYVGCADFLAANGMRILANPLRGDAMVEAGESGSVGIGLMDALSHNTDFKGLNEALEIGPDSTLLCFNTEGATDPVNYRNIIWHGRYPSP
ncbi:MAG: diaminopropionate ammonia-lyase [Deltaproteobacteria bacterium]|jgi:diaminopropionate ammonia-lyase|nr:diaminopropionate ammonia-lyase [Deltaproteobacteria bacterium]MBW2469458.1 diaminopropionate ammonia-lyase [Deltaproteobacteria bacterium]MBW2517005.1 diaminopropionate ammonia-lyase [Deltaproteobacteria bacterium]